MTTFAYARVSARDQNIARQLDAFIEYGIEKKNIFTDKKSGKDFDRAAYRRMLKRLKKGDLLVIKSIDRLGRNYEQIRAEWAKIVNTLGVDILVLDMPLLDTRSTDDSLIGKFISDIVLQVLSFVAQNERETIRSRQAEGIKVAKERVVRFGRPKLIYSDRFILAVQAYQKAKSQGKKITLEKAASLADMKLSAFHYHYQNYLLQYATREKQMTADTDCHLSQKTLDKPL